MGRITKFVGLTLASYVAFIFVFLVAIVATFQVYLIADYFDVNIDQGEDGAAALASLLFWLILAVTAMVGVAVVAARRFSIRPWAPLAVAAVLVGMSLYRPLDYMYCDSFWGIGLPLGGRCGID